MQRLGVTFPLFPLDVRASCEAATRAEQLGYTDAWTAEVSGPDGLSVATALGVVTESMRIGCAIVPAFTRPPALLAMGALAAHQASGGRFVLGIGASSPTIVGSWMGIPFEKPLKRVRDTLDVLRAALAGEKVTAESESFAVDGFRLEGAAPELPIYLAALGPKMLALAAESADGVALYLGAEDGVRIARRAVGDKEIVERIVCVPDVPVEDVLPMLKFQMAPYLAVPAYNRYLRAQGFEAEAEAVATRWGSGDRKGAVEAISDELVDALALIGPAERCKERLESFREAGLDTPILMLISPTGPDGALQALARMSP
ncbi:MAG: LLM class F420-dependent oxidoreductase [Actinomycetota bacterium]